MDLLDVLWHLLNFIAPAVAVALSVSWVGQFFLARPTHRPRWRLLLGINLLVCVAASLGALAFFGRDGKMLGYAAMVLAVATSQWLLSRGWRAS